MINMIVCVCTLKRVERTSLKAEDRFKAKNFVNTVSILLVDKIIPK